MPGGPSDTDILIEDLASYAFRPRAFVYAQFPWGEAGTELAKRTGPEPWQDDVLQFLETALLSGLTSPDLIIAEAIQMAVKSGHNVGKSALVCWLILWAVSTREDTKGVVTANTEKQLRLKLWAELTKWHRLFIAGSLFKVTATSIQAMDPEREREWRIDAIPWSEDNPEAFAGLHNLGKRVLVVFDEASGIADKIWETIDGVMNEAGTELIWLATGNPTRNTGRFRECFTPTGQGMFWKTFSVDSRQVSLTNKDRIQRAIDLWGVDSDFVKVRWLGEFPESGMNQLIPTDVVRMAMLAPTRSSYQEPLILGVDVARFGSNASRATFRRGKDARTIPSSVWRGYSTTDTGNAVANLITTYGPDAVFVDEGGVGGGVVDRLRHLGHTPIGINFQQRANTPLGGELAYNKRAEMYLSLRWWMVNGGAIEDSQELLRELISIEYGYSKQIKLGEAILLAPKDELEESPDWADSLALTFALPVGTRAWRSAGARQVKVDYDPYSPEAANPGLRLPAVGTVDNSWYERPYAAFGRRLQ